MGRSGEIQRPRVRRGIVTARRVQISERLYVLLTTWSNRDASFSLRAETNRWWRVFFFQAEDGIRDYKVTGVQTCALPILNPAAAEHPGMPAVPGKREIGGRPVT